MTRSSGSSRAPRRSRSAAASSSIARCTPLPPNRWYCWSALRAGIARLDAQHRGGRRLGTGVGAVQPGQLARSARGGSPSPAADDGRRRPSSAPSRPSASDVRPASMASVRSHGGTPPPSPRNGSTSSAPSGATGGSVRRRRAWRRRRRAARCPRRAARDQLDGRRVEPDPLDLGPLGDPCLPLPGARRRVVLVTVPPVALTASVSALATRPPPATSTSSVVGSRSATTETQRRHLLGREATHVTGDDDAPCR